MVWYDNNSDVQLFDLTIQWISSSIVFDCLNACWMEVVWSLSLPCHLAGREAG